MKKIVRLTESDLRRIIKESVDKIMDIPTYRTGRRKYYVDDEPEESGVIAGDIDKDGYRTEISPDEYYDLSDYDDGFGYHYIPGNEEPICYDSIDGACYDSGDYGDNDTNMKLSYAKYAHNQSDTPDSVRRYQMDKDFRDIDNRYKFKGNKDDKYSNDYADENLNVLDNKGEWGMGALDKNKVNRRFARNFTNNTPKGYYNAAERTMPLYRKIKENKRK